MFKDPNVRRLLKEAIKDIYKKPLEAIIVSIGPIKGVINRQVFTLISATLIDGFTSGAKDFNWQRLVFWYILISAISLILEIVIRKKRNDISQRAVTERYPRYMRDIFNFPYEMLINVPRGELYPKLRSKVDYVMSVLAWGDDTVKIILNLIVSFFVIATRNKYFAFGYLTVWTISAISLNRLAKSRVHVNKEANKSWDNHHGKIVDLISNAETVSFFNNQDNEIKKIHSQGVVLWAEFVKRWKASRIYMNIITTITFVLNSTMMVFGIWSVYKGYISIGSFVILQSYVGFAIMDITSIGDLSRAFVEETSRATSLDELSEKHPALPEPKQPATPPSNNIPIEFKDVNFQYSDGKEPALENFNLLINKGQKIGIVGRSGSGKTTITKLLLRMYLPNSGEVLFGNKSTFDLGTTNTRSLISYVPQESILFHRTIRENIAYARPDASDKEITTAAKQAHCLDFIDRLPEGINTKVGDKGIKLSGGQRQRIAIARAILKDSPVLIFDEATSSLDSESEGFIQDALNNVMKNKTSIVIAHRLSTLKHMDRIIVIEDGKVAEDGTHKELLERGGLYSSLWNKQSGEFIS